jgi:hypothetical protein
MLFKHTLHYGKHFSPDGDSGGGGSASGDADGDGDGNNDGGSEDGDGANDDRAELKEALAKERKAARDATRQLRDLQKQLDDLKNVGKPEEERREAALKAAEERAAAAEQKIRTANGRIAVSEAVGTTASPRAVFALIRDDIEYDDDDQPTNITDLIAREKKADPSLFRASNGSADGGATTRTITREFSNPTERMSAAYDKSGKAKR